MVKKALLDILSIDWDYFFPNAALYDWGVNEELPICYEKIWATRCFDKNLLSKKLMLDEYKPSIPRKFWNIVTNKPKIFVADSHAFIWHILKQGSTVWNLDAHHDCEYSGIVDEVHCGNWALTGILSKLIAEYHVIYPKWRERTPEKKPSSEVVDFSYSLPEPREYDAIFICRSSCWTPPWADYKFRKFVLSAGMEYEIMNQDGWKLREPSTIEEARNIAESVNHP